MKRIITITLAMLMALAFVGCSKNNSGNNNEVQNTDNPVKYINELGTIVPLSAFKGGSRVVLASDVDPLMLSANNTFTTGILNALQDDWTGAFSPFSMQIALEMLANGGDEETAQKLLDALCPGMTREAVNQNAGRLLAILKNENCVTIDSAVVVDTHYRLTVDFANKVADYYNSAVGVLDFSEPASAVSQINDWVAQNTNNLIDNLLTENDLDRETVIVILNAMSFKLNWKNQMYVLRELMDFNGSKGTESASVIAVSGEYSYGRFENGSMVIIPFENSEFAMAVILPDKGVSPTTASASMLSMISSCQPSSVIIRMPKVELRSNVDFLSMADKLGLADGLAGHYPLLTNDDSVSITRVVQGSAMLVNENGTTASTASAVIGSKGEPRLVGDIEFTCDHPYAMLIYHVATGTVLYVGVVNDIG